MMKPKYSKGSEQIPRDSLPFVRCSSAVEILEGGLALRTNRETRDPRADNNAAKHKPTPEYTKPQAQPFRLDTLLSNHEP